MQRSASLYPDKPSVAPPDILLPRFAVHPVHQDCQLPRVKPNAASKDGSFSQSTVVGGVQTAGFTSYIRAATPVFSTVVPPFTASLTSTIAAPSSSAASSSFSVAENGVNFVYAAPSSVPQAVNDPNGPKPPSSYTQTLYSASQSGVSYSTSVPPPPVVSTEHSSPSYSNGQVFTQVAYPKSRTTTHVRSVSGSADFGGSSSKQGKMGCDEGVASKCEITDVSDIPSVLKSIVQYLESENLQAQGKLEVVKERLESQIVQLTTEKNRYQNDLKLAERKVENLQLKNSTLTLNYEKVQLAAAEFRTKIYDSFRSFVAKEGDRLMEENLEMRYKNRLLNESLVSQNKRQEKVWGLLRRYDLKSEALGDLELDKGDMDEAMRVKALMSDLRDAMNSNLEGEEGFIVAEGLEAPSVAGFPFRDEVVDYLRSVNNSFGFEKSGHIYVKTDENSKAVKELKRQLRMYEWIGRDASIVHEVERFIMNESRLVDQIVAIRSFQGVGKEVTVDGIWDSMMRPYDESQPEIRDSVTVDISYVTVLLYYMSDSDLFQLYKVAVGCGNRHWISLMRSVVYNRFVGGRISSESHGCQDVLDVASHFVRRNIGCKGILDVLKVLYSIGSLPTGVMDPQSGNTLWHFAALENDGEVLGFLNNLSDHYAALEQRNKDGKLPIDLCDVSVKEQFLTTLVFHHANEASEHYRSGNYVAACELYKKALPHQMEILNLASNPVAKRMAAENLAKLHYNKAKALSRLNEWLEAIQCCERCIELLPTYSNAYTTAIQIFENLLDWEAALSYCNKLYDACKIALGDKIVDLKSQVAATKFQILEIPSSSSSAEIKQAFNRLCMVWHPDKASKRSNQSIKKQHENHFNRLREAKKVLLNESSRFVETLKQETHYVPPKPTVELEAKHGVARQSSGAPSNEASGVIPTRRQHDTKNGSLPHPPMRVPFDYSKPSQEGGAASVVASKSTKGSDTVYSSSSEVKHGSVHPSSPPFSPNGFTVTGTKPLGGETLSPNSMESHNEVFPPNNASCEGVRVTGGSSECASNERSEAEDYSHMSMEALDVSRLQLVKTLEGLKLQRSEKLVEVKELESKVSTLSASRYSSQSVVLSNELKGLNNRIESRRRTLAAVMHALEAKKIRSGNASAASRVEAEVAVVEEAEVDVVEEVDVDVDVVEEEEEEEEEEGDAKEAVVDGVAVVEAVEVQEEVEVDTVEAVVVEAEEVVVWDTAEPLSTQQEPTLHYRKLVETHSSENSPVNTADFFSDDEIANLGEEDAEASSASESVSDMDEATPYCFGSSPFEEPRNEWVSASSEEKVKREESLPSADTGYLNQASVLDFLLTPKQRVSYLGRAQSDSYIGVVGDAAAEEDGKGYDYSREPMVACRYGELEGSLRKDGVDRLHSSEGESEYVFESDEASVDASNNPERQFLFGEAVVESDEGSCFSYNVLKSLEFDDEKVPFESEK